MGVLMERLTYS